MGVGIKSLVVGQLEENCYVVYDESSGEAMVIDPGDEPDRIIDLISEDNLAVKYIVCTHTHFDHVGAIPELKKETGAKLIMHGDEKEVYAAAKDMAAFWGYDIDELPEPDMFVREGDSVGLGSLKFEVLHTPGHSPGGICLYGEGILFSGDTVFAGSIGRTDFPGGSIDKMKDSFRRIISLPDETRILPGHGPATTVGAERNENFFMSEL
ncbi:putative metallo-hydrolase [bacterium BMS3Bbin05]|nr:putative metallo-hydrolase [bacterium BMS3Bbin05]